MLLHILIWPSNSASMLSEIPPHPHGCPFLRGWSVDLWEDTQWQLFQ